MRGGMWTGLVTVALLFAGSASAAFAADPRVSAELLAETQAIVPGRTSWIALRQRIAPGWHTYWLNPGDSGEPLRVEWSLPPGFTAGDIAWPAPDRISAGIAMSYGYSLAVVLPIPLTAPPGLTPDDRVTLRGHASWLVCEKTCIPEEAPLTLTLPVARGPSSADPRGAPLIAAARRSTPTASSYPEPNHQHQNRSTFTRATKQRLSQARAANPRRSRTAFAAAHPA